MASVSTPADQPADGASGQPDADPQVLTFGCRLNFYESEVMRRHARQAGLKDVVIVNTCAVTQEAERQARQAIRRARRHHPQARILVTGCAAQINAAAFTAMPEVDQVIANGDKLRPDALIRPEDRAAPTAQQTPAAQPLIDGLEGRARAFVQVQNGCDHRCTFCVIPYGRGPSRSTPPEAVIAQVKHLVRQGCQEVVLTGVDITAWGPDLPGRPGLGRLVLDLLRAAPELPRLRLSSLDCAEMDEDLIAAFREEPRLMPHVHLSLQAGDDLILKRMKRRHSRADAVALCRRLRAVRPDVVFGADLIAGFPTETDAMFENTLSLIDDCGLTWLHVFPYSERPGTPAARFPGQLPKEARRRRAAQLRARGQEAEASFLRSLVGSRAMVLVERERTGRTEQFAPVALTEAAQPGALTPVRITGVEAGGVLQGVVLGAC